MSDIMGLSVSAAGSGCVLPAGLKLGLKKEAVNGVLVQVDQITHLDATLQVGSVPRLLKF